MAEGTKEKFIDAWKVYQDGAFSRPFAVVTLEKPLAHKVKIGTKITGRSTDGSFLDCEALESTEAGETKLKVRYLGSESLDPQGRCAVGANPNPFTVGCESNSGASLLVQLTVDVLMSLLSLQVLVTMAQSKSTASQNSRLVTCTIN